MGTLRIILTLYMIIPILTENLRAKLLLIGFSLRNVAFKDHHTYQSDKQKYAHQDRLDQTAASALPFEAPFIFSLYRLAGAYLLGYGIRFLLRQCLICGAHFLLLIEFIADNKHFID